jgi:hypothetical protein
VQPIIDIWHPHPNLRLIAHIFDRTRGGGWCCTGMRGVEIAAPAMQRQPGGHGPHREEEGSVPDVVGQRRRQHANLLQGG